MPAGRINVWGRAGARHEDLHAPKQEWPAFRRVTTDHVMRFDLRPELRTLAQAAGFGGERCEQLRILTGANPDRVDAHSAADGFAYVAHDVVSVASRRNESTARLHA